MPRNPVIFLAPFFLALCSCAGDLPSSSEAPSHDFSSSTSAETPEFQEGSPLLFSEFYLGSSAATRAVEISNYGDAPILLSAYSIKIFKSNSLTPTYEIAFPDVTLGPNEAYVVAYSQNSEPVDADLLSDDLITNGAWPMGLYAGETRVDTLGTIGYDVAYCTGSIVRKNERRIGREYSRPYDWVRYEASDASHLGEAACPVSQDRLSEGPLLTQEEFDTPYCTENGLYGMGGVLEVGLVSLGDGDTTVFSYPSELTSLGYSGKSFRYQNIDTPETQHGNTIQAQPWGYAAKRWNNDTLRSAKHILIQSVKGGYLTETYGRLLGYVWYTLEENPTPSDYRNLNFETILNGYSNVAFSSVASDTMKSDGVSYYSYFLDADHGAEEQGIKIHGEKDPDFDY